MVSLTIDGVKVTVPDNSTVLDAARQANIEIPTLCYLKGVNALGACRICMVEIVGNPVLQAACVLPVAEGMEVVTNSEKVLKTKRSTLDLLLSNHDRECLTCPRNQNCELQKLSDDLGIRNIKYTGERIQKPKISALSALSGSQQMRALQKVRINVRKHTGRGRHRRYTAWVQYHSRACLGEITFRCKLHKLRPVYSRLSGWCAHRSLRSGKSLGSVARA